MGKFSKFVDGEKDVSGTKGEVDQGLETGAEVNFIFLEKVRAALSVEDESLVEGVKFVGSGLVWVAMMLLHPAEDKYRCITEAQNFVWSKVMS